MVRINCINATSLDLEGHGWYLEYELDNLIGYALLGSETFKFYLYIFAGHSHKKSRKFCLVEVAA